MKIDFVFKESEMKWVEACVSKYMGRKPKTKKELKRFIITFVSTVVSRALDAVDEDKQYIEIE